MLNLSKIKEIKGLADAVGHDITIDDIDPLQDSFNLKLLKKKLKSDQS